MSGNKLLNENTIRRFMKLANVDGLTESFIEDLDERRGAPVEKRKQKKMEEETEETTDTIEEEEEVELEENFEELDEDIEDLEEQEDDEEMDMDMDMDLDAAGDEDDAELGAADISLTEEEARLLIDLGDRLKEAMGDEAEEGDMEDMGDMGGEEDPAMGHGGDANPAMGHGGDANPAMAYSMQENQDELVQEVLKRVTKRLVAAKLNSK